MQLVLLYERKSWLVMGAMIKVLARFHNWSAIRIEGMIVQCMKIGEWDWTLVDDALETAGIRPIKEYI